jgi:predicted ABC-type ATPase
MPNVIVIAGPNGAGRSTAAPALLRDLLGIEDFVNADDIARGLSAFNPEGAAMEAGRLMLARLRQLAAEERDFAFETTLASRSFAPWIAGLKREQEYSFILYYLWVPAPEISIGRVAGRVRKGGQHVPPEVVRRRWAGGIRNFFDLYQPLADKWELYNNAVTPRELVADGRKTLARVYDNAIWRRVLEAKP